MAVRVVDASALAALLFGEPEAESSAIQLADSRLVAPSLLGFELANVCSRQRLPSVWMLRCWRGCAKRQGHSAEVKHTLREEVLSQT
jgi:uncharacterized protein with PIN domain